MDGSRRTGMVRFVAAVLLFVVVLTGTAVADSLTPDVRRAGVAEEVGRAGFAYLTGVRTYAAAVLWNRIDPVFHDYYEELPLTDQTYMLPTTSMVITLDPQLEQPYYVAAWMIAQRGDVETGLDLARQGVENNPRSGLMRVNYAQILWLLGGDVDGAADQARVALSEEAEWMNPFDQSEGYAIIRDVLRAAGEEEMAARVAAERVRIDEMIDQLELERGSAH